MAFEKEQTAEPILRSRSNSFEIDAEINPSPNKETCELEGVRAVEARSQRLHHLDWLRALMVCFVVFAHISTNNPRGILPTDGLAWDNYDFVDEPQTIAVRFVSFIRPWCLPLLFFVSGAAAALSFKRGIGNISAIRSLALFTILGVASNAVLWFLGPMDPNCGVKDVDMDYCQSDGGILFRFTFCPGFGKIFPIIFQMWYTIVLMFFLVSNWPLCIIAYGPSKKPWHALVHFVFWVCVQCALVVGLGSACESRIFSMSVLTICEAIFVRLVWMTSSPRPSWLPLRILHYALLLVTAIQYAVPPLYTPNKTNGDVNFGWILATFVVFFNKSFLLGFVITRPRAKRISDEVGDDVQPLASRYWPALIFPLALFSQTSNFALAGGNLTYPYLHTWQSRFSYVAYALIILLALDRISRWTDCGPMPSLLTWTSLLFYLLHPIVCSFLILAGVIDIFQLWILSAVIILAIVAIVGILKKITPHRSAEVTN